MLLQTVTPPGQGTHTCCSAPRRARCHATVRAESPRPTPGRAPAAMASLGSDGRLRCANQRYVQRTSVGASDDGSVPWNTQWVRRNRQYTAAARTTPRPSASLGPAGQPAHLHAPKALFFRARKACLSLGCCCLSGQPTRPRNQRRIARRRRIAASPPPFLPVPLRSPCPRGVLLALLLVAPGRLRSRSRTSRRVRLAEDVCDDLQNLSVLQRCGATPCSSGTLHGKTLCMRRRGMQTQCANIMCNTSERMCETSERGGTDRLSCRCRNRRARPPPQTEGPLAASSTAPRGRSAGGANC